MSRLSLYLPTGLIRKGVVAGQGRFQCLFQAGEEVCVAYCLPVLARHGSGLAYANKHNIKGPWLSLGWCSVRAGDTQAL